MEIRYAVSFQASQSFNTSQLRQNFVVENLFSSGKIESIYWETDRAVIGSAVPTDAPLKLETDRELAADFFCQRREIGVLNIGSAGKIRVDGTDYTMDAYSCLYIGRGVRDVVFSSDDAQMPARFYFLSYPAHAVHPTTLATQSEANQLHLGSMETANQRTIYQHIHEKGIPSCQLVMGFTRLEEGSVWNTMPPHTHSRRSEVYLYFDVPESAAVVHLMGPGEETRHLLMHSEQAVLSPSWSIHAGCGTQAYGFIWAMGGENQRFDDMDGIAIADLR